MCGHGFSKKSGELRSSGQERLSHEGYTRCIVAPEGAPTGGHQVMSLSTNQVEAGAELRARRTALGLTQAQLALALGVSSNSVARWERAEVPMTSPALVWLALERLEAQSPATESDSASPTLPKPRTSFVGREREAAELRHIVRGDRQIGRAHV